MGSLDCPENRSWIAEDFPTFRLAIQAYIGPRIPGLTHKPYQTAKPPLVKEKGVRFKRFARHEREFQIPPAEAVIFHW